MKVMHIFYSTLPSAKGGDIRSRDVIESQAEIGLDVLAVSSPFQPPAEPNAKMETIGGIPYYRSYEANDELHISEQDQGLTVKIRKALKIFAFADFIQDLGALETPDVIHAHSTFFCAFAGQRAARRLGVPLVYEVRSLWEERSVMKSPSLKTRLIAGAFRRIETLAMRMADHVVVISEGLRSDVINRGIPNECITLVGNAANLARVPQNSASVLYKPSADWIFAYIGNLSDIEGLDLLIEAVRDLRVAGWNNLVYIYGDGPAKDDLQLLAQGVEGVVFKGRFKPEDAPKIYKSVDVVVNPRRRSPLTDKVTPLKPLEAMAWRKPVIISSVSGMLELVKDGETGFVFNADDAAELAKVLRSVTDAQQSLPDVIEAAYQFVLDDRSWSRNGLKYLSLYRQLTGLEKLT